MSEAIRTSHERVFPFGLIELDAAGVVARFEPARGETRASASEVVGRNFFDDIAPAAEVAELKGRFLAFMTFGDSEQHLDVTFPADHTVVRARLTLLRAGGITAGATGPGGARRAVVRLSRVS